MATRAIQSPLIILGFRNPTTDVVLSGGTVEFYAAGTNDAKIAWEDKDKLVPVTSVTLDSAGQAKLYFDGVYKFIVKDSEGTTQYTLDNLKYQARNTNIATYTADYQANVDDDYLLGDTDGGNLTFTLPPAADAVAPVTVKNIGSAGNGLTVQGFGGETIDGVASVILADAVSQVYVSDNTQWFGAGISLGNEYTALNLVSGTNNSFDIAAGVTTINVPDAAVAVKGAIAIATDLEAEAGISEVLAVNPKQLKTTSVFTQAFYSGGQVIVSGELVDLTHGLGVKPKLIYYELECVVANNGFAVGDMLNVSSGTGDTTGNRFNSAVINDTNITLRYAGSASVFRIQSFIDGGSATFTNSHWLLHISAFA